jgi:hypothetical protein
MALYSFISPQGTVVKTNSIQEFATTYGFRPSHARSLACGYHATAKGWCTTKPSGRKRRKRFLTPLINVKNGTREVLGESVTGFARRHNLCKNEVYRLINGRSICYRGWMIENSYQLAQTAAAYAHF